MPDVGQAADHRRRQVTLADMGHSLVIDDVIIVREEVGAVLRAYRASRHRARK